MAFLPISELNAYVKKGWAIKARLSTRGPVREFKKAGGEVGRVLNLTLIDAGSEIRATLWSETAQKYDAMLKPGQMYTFKGGMVKLANKKFSSCKHDYELSFDKFAEIEPTADDAAVEMVKYAFVELRTLRDKAVPCMVDLCVVVKEAALPRDIRGDGSLFLRKCVVVDSSEQSIELAIWEPTREERSLVNSVLCCKSASIKDFGGRSASVNGSSVHVDADVPEARALKAWWAQGGDACTVTALTGTQVGGKDATWHEGSLADIEEASASLQMDQSLFYKLTSPLYLNFIRTTTKEGVPMRLTYDACPDCFKKVEGTQCMKCNKDVQPMPRLMMSSVRLEDTNAQQYVSMFDNVAHSVLGMTSEQVAALEGDSEALQSKLKERYFTERYNAKIRARMGEYNGELRCKCSLLAAEKLDETEQSREMLATMGERYGSFSPNAQAEIQELLAMVRDQDADIRKGWQSELTRLAAVVA